MLKRKKIYAIINKVFKIEKIKKYIVDTKHELLKKVSANEKISTTWLVKTVYEFCQIYAVQCHWRYLVGKPVCAGGILFWRCPLCSGAL